MDFAPSIAWRREACKEEALGDFAWKDERGPSSLRQTLKLFQRQQAGETRSERRSGAHLGFSWALRYHAELNWNELEMRWNTANAASGDDQGLSESISFVHCGVCVTFSCAKQLPSCVDLSPFGLTVGYITALHGFHTAGDSAETRFAFTASHGFHTARDSAETRSAFSVHSTSFASSPLSHWSDQPAQWTEPVLDTRWLVFRLDVACAPAQWTHKLRSLILLRTREPVWPSGKLVSGRTSVWYRFGSPFSSKVVVCWHCLVTLSHTIGRLPRSRDLDLGFAPWAETRSLYYRLSVGMVSWRCT